MKRKRPCILRWQIFCLQLFLVLLGSILTQPNVLAQESITGDEAAKPTPLSDDFGPSTPIKPDADSKLPDVIRDLMPSIVRVTRVEQTEPAVGESARPAPFSHVGVVVDSRGYIVIPILPGPAKFFVVRFSNQQEAMAELVAIDDSLRIGVDGTAKLGVLKIENRLPIKAISISANREARLDERVLLVPSSNSQKVHIGRIQTNAVQLSEGSEMLIQADIACSLSDFGRLMVSEAGEPIGLVLASSRSGSKSMSFALPMKAIQPVLQAAIDKPRDVPLARVTQSQSATDLAKQAQPFTADSTMPDISGRWTIAQDDRAAREIVLSQRDGDSFVFEYVSELEIVRVQWSPTSKQFLGAITTMSPLTTSKLIIEPTSDPSTLRVGIWLSDQAKLNIKKSQPSKPIDTLYQIWSRPEGWQRQISAQQLQNQKSLSYIQPGEADSREITKIFHLQWSNAAAMFGVLETLFEGKVRRISADRRTNSLIVVALPSFCDEVEAILLKLDTKPSQQPSVQTNFAAIPDTPEAKQLNERLVAQESAAASAANEIRRLQENGDAIETIAPYHAQLKAHLQTAFELKMQLEELQVKELHSRLSRLERQIGQRKELREKIIARRAAELISGDSLRWNPTAETRSASLGDATKQGSVPNSRAGTNEKELYGDPAGRRAAVESGNHQPDPQVFLEALRNGGYVGGSRGGGLSVEQKLRWRSAIVEIFVETKISMADIQQISVGSGVLVSSSGLVLSQLSNPPKDSKFLARLDDGSQLPLEIVEFPGSNLYVFQLPPNTPINHYFKLSGDQFTPSSEVYVFGKNTSSPENKLGLFTAQVALKDRQVRRWDLVQLRFWQLAKPDNYGPTESWPALNANGELLGITLRDTGDLLLVLPVEELKKVFPKTLGEMLNSPGVERREAPSISDAKDGNASKVPEAATPLIETNTAIPASQPEHSMPANAQSRILDFIRDEAYSHVEDITTLQYAFDVKDDNGWHAETQFFADQMRFRVNRKDLAGMQVKGKRITPLTSASAFDGLRQQYLDTNGRLRLKNGCEGASYGIGTPHLDVYSWLRRGPGDLRWDIICNHDLWKQRFAEAEYIGAIPEKGRTLEIVDFPARLEGQKPCTYRVFFARDLRFFPIKCLRRVSATTETSTTVIVTDFKSIEKGDQRFILPTTLTYSESHADDISMKQQRTTTVAVESLKVNEPIDEAVFTIDGKDAKETYNVQEQESILSLPSIEAISVDLDASAAAIKNMSVTTDYKKRHVYGLPFDAPIELTLVAKTIIDSKGRLRVETSGQQINIEPDGKSARAYNGRWETVFRDGEARSLTWYESNPPTASIDKSPSLHGIHPREFTTHFQSKSVSEIIRTRAADIAERTMWDDRPVTIVQTTPIKNSNDSRRYRFWIDLERKVVVRRAISIRFAEGQPWQEYARIENHDYQEIAPEIWLPSKVKYESLEVTPELTPAKLSWSYEGTNRDWKVNNELPADTFELAFPEGTFVNDHRTPSIEARAANADMESLRKSEMDSFQGTWCFDVLQSSRWPKPIGEPTDSSGRKSQQRWIIKGDLITWTSLDNEPIGVSFTIDPTKTPKQIDFTFLTGPQKGLKSVGLYEPQKGNANYLWLCMTNPGTDAPRPTEVGYSSEKQQSMIGIYPVERPNTAPLSDSYKRLQGEWKMTLCDFTHKGFGGSQEVVSKWSWVIRGNEILWSRDDDMWKLKLDVDSSKSPGENGPGELDLTYLTGPFKGAKCLGMFQWGGVDKKQLMIAIQDPYSDAPRPTKFSMDSSIRTGLMILER